MGEMMAPTTAQKGHHNYWKSSDPSVNAVSFGFVATAVLISMFLVIAILERFLRPNAHPSPPPPPPPPPVSVSSSDFPDNIGEHEESATIKRDDNASTEMKYSFGVSVLMPGQNFPTFIANPAPVKWQAENAADPNPALSTHV